MNGILEGKSIEQMIGKSKDKWINATPTEIKNSIKGELSQNDVFVIKDCLEMVKFLDVKIKESIPGYFNLYPECEGNRIS